MRPLALELAATLTGGRVDKISQQSKAALTIAVRQPGQTHLLQLSINPQNPAVYLTTNAGENLPEPPTPDDTAESIAEKVHRLEMAHYPAVLEKLFTAATA